MTAAQLTHLAELAALYDYSRFSARVEWSYQGANITSYGDGTSNAATGDQYFYAHSQIDAALQVIVEQGYEGVSIEAIARTAGVTRPVIYGVSDRPQAGLLTSGTHALASAYWLPCVRFLCSSSRPWLPRPSTTKAPFLASTAAPSGLIRRP